MKQWIKEIVISPILLIGPLFHEGKWSSRFYMLGMQATTLFAGTWLMRMNFVGSKMHGMDGDSSMMPSYWESLANMYLAMTISRLGYSVGADVLTRVGLFCTQGCREQEPSFTFGLDNPNRRH